MVNVLESTKSFEQSVTLTDTMERITLKINFTEVTEVRATFQAFRYYRNDLW